MRRSRVDAVVIGAGTMGSATAYWLARDGLDVVLVERFAAGHDRGSSHGATRIFRFAYMDPLYVRMAQAALPLWREVEEEAGVTLLEQTGGVDHGNPVRVRAISEAMTSKGAEHELLSPAEAASRWPGMRFEGEVLFHSDGGRIYADRSIAAFQELAAKRGGALHFGRTASLSVDGGGDGVRVRSEDAEWEADVAVVTAGAWVRSVLAGAGLADRLPAVKTTQEQIQHFTPRPGHEDLAGWPSFIHHRPFWHYGLFSPDEGMKVAVHRAGLDVDPDARPDRDDALEGEVVDYVSEWFPGLEPEPRHRATCLYTVTPDEDFIIDRVGPVVVGSPCSGHGFKFTPLVGRILADLAEGRPRPADWGRRLALG
jgi:sarcosine oxidase